MKRMLIFLTTIFHFIIYAEIESRLLKKDLEHPSFLLNANLKDTSLYEEGEKDPIRFWEKCAEEVHWFQKWDTPLVWTSPYAKWYLNGKLNISYNCLDKHLKSNGDKLALIFCDERGEERKLTYQDLYVEVCRLANGLKSLGIRKGDVVTIYMPMVPEGIAAMLACARIGAVHSVIFGGTGAGSLKEKIKDAQAKLVITADEGTRRGKTIHFRKIVDEIVSECPSVQNIVVLKRNTQDLGEIDPPNYISYKTLLETAQPDCPPEPMDSEDVLFVLYTSGTTGKPKGIIHTTGGYLVGVHNTFKWVFDYKPEDIFWCTADIGWITGHSYIVYGPMSNGATQVIYEGAFDYPERDQAWKIIQNYRVTTFYTAPTLIRTFMKWGPEYIKNCNINSLRLLGSIGEPLNPEAWQWYYENVGNSQCPIVDTWFQTETGALVISPLPGITALKPGSIAQPLPGFQAAILNDDGKDVEHGYLAITAPFPSMLRGILNDPDRYYDTYWAKWDGKYYYPGDDALIDSDEYIWINGRADEVLKVAGHRIGTAEVENAILECSIVSESAVVGIPDSIKGQKIIALVVLKEGTTKSSQLELKIQEAVTSYIGKYAQPEQIVFIRDLPKTRSGKILRRVIANLIEGKPKGDISTLQNPDIISDLEVICSQIREAIESQKG